MGTGRDHRLPSLQPTKPNGKALPVLQAPAPMVTLHIPRFSPTPTHTSRFRPAPRNTPFPQNGLSFGWLVSAGNLCFMVAIPLPASDWKFNRQALEMLLLSLSSPHTHQSESIKPTGLYVSSNAPPSRMLIRWTYEEERPSFESMISLTGHIKSKT